MIVTLTANPSLDRAVTLGSALVPGGVHRIEEDSTDPGGKGINVALGTDRAGITTRAVLPAGPSDPLLKLLDEYGLTYTAVPISGQVRTNLTVLAGGVTTKINEPGFTLTSDDVSAVERALSQVVSEGDHVMLSGSLAPGFPRDEYSRLVGRLRPLGVWIGIDTSDDPLVAVGENLQSNAPDFLKPNGLELGQLTGSDGIAIESLAALGDLGPVRDAAVALVDRGVQEVLVTLGPAGGVLATTEGVWFAPSPDVPVVSTVGAGDSATAGYLIAKSQGRGPAECLACAVAYGAVAVSLPGTTIPNPQQVHPQYDSVIAL